MSSTRLCFPFVCRATLVCAVGYSGVRVKRGDVESQMKSRNVAAYRLVGKQSGENSRYSRVGCGYSSELRSRGVWKEERACVTAACTRGGGRDAWRSASVLSGGPTAAAREVGLRGGCCSFPSAPTCACVWRRF